MRNTIMRAIVPFFTCRKFEPHAYYKISLFTSVLFKMSSRRYFLFSQKAIKLFKENTWNSESSFRDYCH